MYNMHKNNDLNCAKHKNKRNILTFFPECVSLLIDLALNQKQSSDTKASDTNSDTNFKLIRREINFRIDFK